MAEQPLLPRSRMNPVGQTRLYRKTIKRVKKRLSKVRDWLLRELESIPVREVEVNVSLDPDIVVNSRIYEYLINPDELDRVTDQILEEIGEMPARTMTEAAASAYEIGTGMAVENLRRISDDYNRDLVQVMGSDPYRRRAALIRSRVFEEMVGFTGDTRTELARVLREGIENGFNPREVAKHIRRRTGVSKTRAERIARTEIGQAQRRARLDEAQDAQQSLGLQTKMLWLSALSPTTRDTHARRHGKLYTAQEVREFYSRDANAINCKCAQTEVLVDDEGNPRTPGVVDRVKAYK